MKQHFEEVDKPKTEAKFTERNQHRLFLYTPFIGRSDGRTLCVIGQNPSDANTEWSDRTLSYLQRLVYETHPEYSGILMLNLFTRVDKIKEFSADLNCSEADAVLEKYLTKDVDVLLVTGASKRDGAYDFDRRRTEIFPLLKPLRTLKIDTGANTDYAPHPGNPKIMYRKYDLELVDFRCDPHN